METRPWDEGFLRRAVFDSARHLKALWFWGVEIVVGPLAAVASTKWLPTGTTPMMANLYAGLSGLGAVLLFALLVFLFTVVRAPFRQRDEARAKIATSTESDLVAEMTYGESTSFITISNRGPRAELSASLLKMRIDTDGERGSPYVPDGTPESQRLAWNPRFEGDTEMNVVERFGSANAILFTVRGIGSKGHELIVHYHSGVFHKQKLPTPASVLAFVQLESEPSSGGQSLLLCTVFLNRKGIPVSSHLEIVEREFSSGFDLKFGTEQ